MTSEEHRRSIPRIVAALTAEGDIGELRSAYEALLGATRLPADVTVEAIDCAGVGTDRVSIAQGRSDRAILYLHGGGYAIGANPAYREFAGRLARATGSVVYVPDYRLAPEHPFPAALQDAVAAYRWLIEREPRTSIVLAGDSAGAGLVLATLACLRDEGDPLPAAAIGLSPWADLEGTGDSCQPGATDDPIASGATVRQMGALYAPGNLQHPYAAPLHADYRGFPPLLLLASTMDVLVDDARRVARKAEAAGVKVRLIVEEGLIHVWPVLVPDAPESGSTLRQVAEFIDSTCS